MAFSDNEVTNRTSAGRGMYVDALKSAEKLNILGCIGSVIFLFTAASYLGEFKKQKRELNEQKSPAMSSYATKRMVIDCVMMPLLITLAFYSAKKKSSKAKDILKETLNFVEKERPVGVNLQTKFLKHDNKTYVSEIAYDLLGVYTNDNSKKEIVAEALVAMKKEDGSKTLYISYPENLSEAEAPSKWLKFNVRNVIDIKNHNRLKPYMQFERVLTSHYLGLDAVSAIVAEHGIDQIKFGSIDKQRNFTPSEVMGGREFMLMLNRFRKETALKYVDVKSNSL